MRASALLVIAACGSPSKQPAPVKLVDATSFRAMLDDKEEQAHIREIRIVPLGHHVARYLVFRSDRAFADEIDAEYPGSLVGQIEHVRIPHRVDPAQEVSWPHTTHELRDMQPAAFRALFDCPTRPCEQATRIQDVMIEPVDGDQARYVITWKTTNKRDVVTAPFPDDLVDLMAGNLVPYGVRAPALELE